MTRNVFYDTIDAMCKEKGINHSTLAMRCHIGPVTFHRYLTLQREFKLRSFMAMCKELKMSAEVMYTIYENARKEQNDD